MGKGNRNRQNRTVEPKQPETKKKVRRYRKPLSGTAKAVIASAVCLLLVVGIVFGALVSNGTFKRGNILVKSKTGEFDVNQQMATYLVWDAMFYTASYQWSYLSDSIKTEYPGISTELDWCLTFASGGVQEQLKTQLNTYANTLKEYVAVCDVASSFGITLTNEEKKQAKDDAKNQIQNIIYQMFYQNYSSGGGMLGTNAFLKAYIGNNVKMSDIEDAMVIQTLYNKVLEKKEADVTAAVTDDILNKYRNDNPESFYSTDYLLYTTTETALKDALLAATSENAFKEVIVKDYFDNGSTNFVTVYNKHVSQNAQVATDTQNALDTAIKDATDANGDVAAALTTALTAQGMTEAEYLNTDETLNATLKEWLFKSDTKKYATKQVVSGDKYYIAVVTEAAADGKVKAAIKTLDALTGETHGEDTAFKQNMLNTILNEFELLSTTEGLTLYNETEDETIKKIIADLKTAVEKVIPADKNEKYAAEPTADTFQHWMFADVDKTTFASPVAAGAVKDFSKTENSVTTYSIYFVLEPMKLNTEPVINGGYILFEDSTDGSHSEQAQKFIESLNGLTGDALADKFSENASSVISEAIAKSSVTATELADWLFAADRAADNYASIAVSDTTPDDAKENKAGTYVAFYRGSELTWKNNAKNGYINETLQNWVTELITTYTLDGMNSIKDRTPVQTQADTTPVTA